VEAARRQGLCSASKPSGDFILSRCRSGKLLGGSQGRIYVADPQ
jgi:hypothetical protein